MRKHSIIVAALLLVAAPLAVAQEEGPDENSDWGRCQAFYASENGNNHSNETVYSTPAFNNTSDESCQDETAPYNGTPAEDHAGSNPGQNADDRPDDPGQPEDPGAPEDPGGDQAPDDPGQPEDPGAPEDPGGGQAPDDPGQPEDPGGGSNPGGGDNPGGGQALWLP